MAIKQTLPFDTLSVQEEYRIPMRRLPETFEVRSRTGHVAERIYKKLLPSDTTIFYCGRRFPIQGEGFKRFIQV